MRAKRRLTPDVVERIKQRKAQNLTHAEIALEFGISTGSVGNALAMKSPRAPTVDAPGDEEAESVSPKPPAEPEKLLSTPTPERLMAMAWKTAQRLDGWADTAQGEQDRAAYRSLARDLLGAIKELSRLLPPPAPDPEQAPDVVAAAKRARAALHALVEHELTRGSV